MARAKLVYACQQCGHHSPKWAGKCPDCGGWNTLVEEVERPEAPVDRPSLGGTGPQPITNVRPLEHSRIPTGLKELDRVLGGGIVFGSVSLIGGDPGIGKSTLLLQISERIARAGSTVLYITAEESVYQTKLRAERLGVLSDRLLVYSETNLDEILGALAKTKPAVAVIDSVQMIYKPALPSAPGTVGQVRECATDLVFHAKREGTALFLVGHVTKEGSIAGPRTLEHLVDAVFYIEGDRFQSFRILRGVKNRFGSTNEIGIFEMTGGGLTEVENPSELFLSRDRAALVGSAVVPSIVGTRPLLVEIQALTAKTHYGMPARRVTGVDANRTAMILAVLERRAGLQIGLQDVFVNAVGGVQVDEPAADLAVAAAVASSFQGKSLSDRTLLLGEVGLAGELRGVGQTAVRLQEGVRLGFKAAIVPAGGRLEPVAGLEIVKASTLRQALDAAGLPS